MAIPVKLQVFEGPLDLLLHLIDKNKVNIYDIPIAEITDQYLSYIAGMETQDLEVMSEFLVMAATLLDIKTRMLLPQRQQEDGEEEDPRAELVEQLLQYKMFRYMSQELKDREVDAACHLYREASIPLEVASYREPVDLTDLLAGVNLSRLNDLFKDLLRRQDDRVDPIHSRFGRIEKDEVDLAETMQFVESQIMEQKSCTFRSLLSLRKGKQYVVVTFLTMLELMRLGRISVAQEGTFEEIYITARDPSEWKSPEELGDTPQETW